MSRRRLHFTLSFLFFAASTTALAWTNSLQGNRGQPIRTIHIQELRSAINAKRAGCSLPQKTWSDTLVAGTTEIRAVHITELRQAISDIYRLQGLAPPVFSTDPIIVPRTTTIKARHITELRTAVDNAPACIGQVNCIGSWGVCSRSCGGGTHTYTITTPASGGGKACSVPNGATQACNTKPCRTNGSCGASEAATSFLTAPTTGLCTTGTTVGAGGNCSGLNGTIFDCCWSWTCSGSGGGTSSQCWAGGCTGWGYNSTLTGIAPISNCQSLLPAWCGH